MNLGAFGVIIAVARRTRSAELSSFNGLFEYAPGLTVVMTVFLFALAGIPPLAGWFAKFEIFRATANAGTGAGYVMAVFVAVNSVIALFYYARIAQAMWMQPAPDGDHTPIRVPPALVGALAICTVAVVAVGVYPQLVARVGDMAQFALG
jgi:NADH-quinone oxidoreductase subunit N